MKVLFYRTLLNCAKNITPNERILYSFLASKSIQCLDFVFDEEGESLILDELYLHLENCHNMIDLCKINHTKISTILGQTRKTIINGIKHLMELGYIVGDKIYVSKSLVEHGYFELVLTDKLCGELLIFYSYLVDKGSMYGYCIDTKKYKIGETFGKSKVAVTKLLNRLYEKGLAKRDEKGRLVIL